MKQFSHVLKTKNQGLFSKGNLSFLKKNELHKIIKAYVTKELTYSD